MTKIDAMVFYMTKLTVKGFTEHVNEDGSYDALGAFGKAIGMSDEEIMSPDFSKKLEDLGLSQETQSQVSIHNDLVSPSQARQKLVDIIRDLPNFELEYTSSPMNISL